MIEPRNWKWMLPAAAVPVLLVVFFYMVTSGSSVLKIFSVIAIAWAYICLDAAVKNRKAYFLEHDVTLFHERQTAAAINPVTELARSFNGLHPAFAKLLTMHTQTVWMLREGHTPTDLGIIDYILYGTRIPVRLAFVIHVLRNSTGWTVMPERQLADGTKVWDPDNEFTDREQYRELITYWRGQGRITNSHGNMPAEWIYPWTPQAVADAMDLDIKLEAQDESEKENASV